jgi:hypothetical protein
MNEKLHDTELPEYLQGLEMPATKDDAIMHAAEHGAPEQVLEYMEHLPAAIFTSEAGMRHAFATLDSIDVGDLVTLRDEADEAEDGLSS